MKIRSLREIIRSLERDLAGQLKDDTVCCGVTMAQCHALMEIGLKSNTSISSLADNLNLDKSTLSRTIDTMVKSGLVQREIDPRDRRFMAVRLTEAGQQLYDDINRQSDAFYHKIMDLIPDEKQFIAFEGLKVFADALHKVKIGGSKNKQDCL